MAELITSDGTFYNVEVFIKYYELDKRKVYTILRKSNEQILLDNLFVFKDKYYITIVGFMFIVYMYRIPADNPKSKTLFIDLLQNVSDIKTFSYKLLDTYVDANDLPYGTDKVLVMDNKEHSAYLCMFKIENTLKLGVSYSAKVRLEYELKHNKVGVELVEIYHMGSLTIAKQAMATITLMYHKLKNKDGNFKANGNIRNMINKRLSNHIIK